MATSHLKNAILDLKARILSVPQFVYCAVFNDQVKVDESGKTFPFLKPAVLVEITNPMSGVQLLGSGVTVNDIVFRFSIVHEQMNAVSDGTPGSGMDENLDVFDLRDLLKTKLTGFKPTNCSNLQYCEESQDYAHNNIYVYGVSFKCSYVDTKGSGYDVDSTTYRYINPPIALDLQAYYTIPPTPKTGIQYGWKVCKILAQVVDSPDGSTQTLDNGDIIPLQYTLNGDGTLTIPELVSFPGIAVLTSFINEGQNIPTVTYAFGTFSNDAGGGFPTWSGRPGDEISFNASLPLYTPA